MTCDAQKAPFPWFGGKSQAAPAVWQALGDPHHYVEPFAGSLAVLLRRPHQANRTYYSETVNDADGLFLRGGMGKTGAGGQQHRERLWLSPHCLGDRQRSLFEVEP